MSWLSNEFGKLGHFASTTWDHNRNFVGNLAKNVSPLLAFTPLGPLGSGALGALGEAAEKGSNFGDILKSGASNAAIGAGAHSLVGAARGALGGASAAGGGSAAGTVAPTSNFAAGAAGAAPAAPGATLPGVSMAGSSAGAIQGPGAAALNLPSAGAVAASPGAAQISFAQPLSTSSKLLQGLQGTGSFLKNNAPMLGQAASGVLNARENGQQLDFQKQQYADQQRRQQQLAAILGPLYQQLLAQRGTVAPNPYAANPYTSPASAGTSRPGGV